VEKTGMTSERLHWNLAVHEYPMRTMPVIDSRARSPHTQRVTGTPDLLRP
jgi:hypothetical protein